MCATITRPHTPHRALHHPIIKSKSIVEIENSQCTSRRVKFFSVFQHSNSRGIKILKAMENFLLLIAARTSNMFY